MFVIFPTKLRLVWVTSYNADFYVAQHPTSGGKKFPFVHVSLVLSKNRQQLLSMGFSSPAPCCFHNGGRIRYHRTTHSEMDALNNLGSSSLNRSQKAPILIFNFAMTPQGTIRKARPCLVCSQILQDITGYSIHSIIWTQEDCTLSRCSRQLITTNATLSSGDRMVRVANRRHDDSE